MSCSDTDTPVMNENFTFRYKAVMGDFQRHRPSKRRTFIHVLIIWFFAILSALPNVFLYEFKFVRNTYYGIKPYCSTHNSMWKLAKFRNNQFQGIISNLGSTYFRSYFDIYIFATLIYQYLAPLIILSFAYTLMSMKLSKNPTPGVGNECNTKKKSIKMMIVIVIVFAITWLPYQVFCTLKVLWIDFNK